MEGELAAAGSLFLDEIGDLPLEAQVKLLRYLDDRRFERVGGTEALDPDVRILAATNRSLQEVVAQGRFREDLYFRLQVFPVRLPPLRERADDIPLLAVYSMERMSLHLNKGVRRIAPPARAQLQRYGWPGNVRELEHVVQRAVIVSRGETIEGRDILIEPGGGRDEVGEELVSLEALERRHSQQVLERVGWRIGGDRGAAVVLGLKESTLRGRMRKLGIRRPGS